MADRHAPEDVDPALATAARHALHDEELIAAFAGGDTDAEESARAKLVVDRCPTCRDLYADLAAITLTLKATPSATEMAALRPAPRDFRLTPQVAARLRPASPLGRLAQRLAELVGGFGRPAGMALATFGLVGVLVGTVGQSGLGFGDPMAGNSQITTTSSGGDLPGAASTQAPGDAGPAATPAAEDSGEKRNDLGLAARASDGVPWLLVGSLALVILGVALLVIGTQVRSRNRLDP